jgi:hypothetical protein
MPVSSEWGRDVAVLSDPHYVPSEWGSASTTVEGGPVGSATSEWGRTSTTLRSPRPVGASPWGKASVVLHGPHHPIGVMTSTGVEYVAVQSWDGATWA